MKYAAYSMQHNIWIISKFYSFVQANTIDSLMNLNDRLEYETLWRYPIRDNLMSAVGKRNELATSGHFKLFSDFEKIHNDMNRKHSEFKSARKDFIQFSDLFIGY